MTSKLITNKILNGKEVFVYRHPIIAAMQFCYKNGRTIKNKMHQIGHYDYEIIVSDIGETISEKILNKVFYNN